MRKDSAIQILLSFRRQLNDAKRIFVIFASAMIVDNVYLLYVSENCMLSLLVGSCLISALLAVLAYWKYLLFFLKSGCTLDFYIAATIEYILVIWGFSSLFLYIFVEQRWAMLNQYGMNCLFLFNTYINWLLPITLFLMVSCTYWLIMHLIQKESKQFYLLEKKKNEIYE